MMCSDIGCAAFLSPAPAHRGGKLMSAAAKQ